MESRFQPSVSFSTKQRFGLIVDAEKQSAKVMSKDSSRVKEAAI